MITARKLVESDWLIWCSLLYGENISTGCLGTTPRSVVNRPPTVFARTFTHEMRFWAIKT